MVSRYLERMRSGAELDADDYVIMTRLWNTIDGRRMEEDNETYRDYQEAYFPECVARASKSLGALPTKGMALYSKQYDLYIGGKPHANSQYRLAPT